MGTPPNQTGKTFDNRKSAVTTPIDDAIAMETCEAFLEELMALEAPDIRQMRKRMHLMSIQELDNLKLKLTKLRNAVYEIRYERSPKGIAAREARKLKQRKKP